MDQGDDPNDLGPSNGRSPGEDDHTYPSLDEKDSLGSPNPENPDQSSNAGGAEGIDDYVVNENEDLYEVLPPWANEENQAINNLVKQKEQLLHKERATIQESMYVYTRVVPCLSHHF